jgi:16S rRNA (cytidine1402-2'-O)-methyltransferase
MTNGPAGRLYVVATPIGNLGDLSPRARAVLSDCALIAAEDTRHTGVLLKAFGIQTPQLSLHDHNERHRAPEIIEKLRHGASVALVSDAGTPAISDPGFDLVRAVAAAGFEIVAIPGPCAAIAALSIGALPTDRFCFEGFLPARGAARRKRLQSLRGEGRTLVLYEAPHRVRETLEDCAAVFGGERSAMAAREITKMHETAYRGSLRDLCARAESDPDFNRGEMVLVIAGEPQPVADDERGADGHGGALDRALKILLAELPLKQAARLAAQITEARDNEAYKRALLLKQECGGRMP